MELTSYKADLSATEQGRWFPLRDAKVKLVSLTSTRARNHIRKSEKVIATYRRSGLGIPEEVVNDNLVSLLAEAIIVDWSNFKENGVEIPFSTENAKRILKDYEIIREAIATILQDNNSFVEVEAEYTEASEKN